MTQLIPALTQDAAPQARAEPTQASAALNATLGYRPNSRARTQPTTTLGEMTEANNAVEGSRWFEALLYPAALVAEATRSDKQTLEMGLALLLEVQLLVYNRVGADNGWPKLGAEAPLEGETSIRLLAAVGRELAGHSDAPHELAGIASAEPAAVASVATVLAANAYARRDDLPRARELLGERLAAAEDAVERRLLLIHLGLRAAEADDFDEAVSRTREARGEEPPENTGFERTLWVVATHNLWRFESQLASAERTVDRATLPLRTNWASIRMSRSSRGATAL